jgi:dUTP pyrophosphatase
MPRRGTQGSIGYNLHATKASTIAPDQRSPVCTGLSIRLLGGTYGRIAPRSGLAVKHSIDVAVGVIDPDY